MQTNIVASIQAVQAGPNDFSGLTFAPLIRQSLETSLGTGANQADILFADERQVAASSNDDLDLVGVLTNAFGALISAAELVAVLIINAPLSGAANTTNLTIGGGTNPVVGFLGGTTPTIGPIRPGGFVFLGCGDAAGLGVVSAGTGDILRIANSAGATARYQIAIVARSVA
jgi:hypothetical protein